MTGLSAEEIRALRKLRAEAKAVGAVLANGGRGNLTPSFALGVMRRDGYTCKVHGDRGEGDNGGLTLHHKGGAGVSRWLKAKGHRNVLNNLVTMCKRAHNEVHDRAEVDTAHELTPTAPTTTDTDEGV